MKCNNCLHFGVCVYVRMLPGEIRDDDNFKCPDFADGSRDRKVHVMNITDCAEEFTRAERKRHK